MANAIVVPGLAKKLKLLGRDGQDVSLKHVAALLDVKYSTLKWYVSGDASRPPDTVPPDVFEKVVDAFAPLLPGRDRKAVRTLLLAPSTYLEGELAARRTVGLLALIEAEAVRGQSRLFRASSDLALTEIVDRRSEDAFPAIRLGEAFRLEFPTDRRFPYAFAVQNAGADWGGLTLSRIGEATIHVPRHNANDTPGFMVERTTPGHHRFVCFQSAQPFPAVLNEYVADCIALDKRALETLAAFYSGLPLKDRSSHLIELRVAEKT